MRRTSTCACGVVTVPVTAPLLSIARARPPDAVASPYETTRPDSSDIRSASMDTEVVAAPADEMGSTAAAAARTSGTARSERERIRVMSPIRHIRRGTEAHPCGLTHPERMTVVVPRSRPGGGFKQGGAPSGDETMGCDAAPRRGARTSTCTSTAPRGGVVGFRRVQIRSGSVDLLVVGHDDLAMVQSPLEHHAPVGDVVARAAL